MKSARQDRVDSEYRREIAAILSGALKDKEPELKGIVSVTAAEGAADFKTAKVYVSVYAAGKEQEAKTFEVIRENAGFIRKELARVMRTRTVPALTFIADGSMAYGSKMDAILNGLHKDEN